MVRKVILDVDTGVDDAQAIILALRSPELKVEAVTAVSGNAHVDYTSMNSLKVLELAGVNNIPVAKGMSKPLIRDYPSPKPTSHGPTGLADVDLPAPKSSLYQKHAVELLIELIMSQPGEITLIPVGPLSNIAAAILKEPKLVDAVEEVIMMSGAFNMTPYGHGNATPVAELNVWFDAEAAKIVYNAGFKRITAVGLDVTTDPSNCITEEHLKKLSVRDPVEDFIIKLNRWRMRAGWGPWSRVHDPMAVAIAINKNLATTKRLYCDVEINGSLTYGMTVSDHRPGEKVSWSREGKQSIDVCCGVDGKRFIDFFIDRVITK